MTFVDTATFTAPISADNPAGSPVPYTLRKKLEDERKDKERSPEDPNGPPMPRKPDWKTIRRETENILKQTSKDLETCLRWIEALVKLEGFAGLREGLGLLRELINQCWDFLHPIPDPGEGAEVRSQVFGWITEAEKGARFPMTIRAIPVVKIGDQAYSLLDRQMAVQGSGPVPSDDFLKAVPLNAGVAEEVSQSLANLEQLDQLLNEKLGKEAPSFSELRQALLECQEFVAFIVARNAPAATDAAAEVEGMAENGKPADGSGVLKTRAEAYRQLAQIANTLERLEPHSPIPSLLRRAIELGQMPFGQLIRELIRDNNMLAELRREFGIREEQTSG